MAARLMLVDDDQNILASVSVALEAEGFDVTTFFDSEMAMIELSRNPPDLAVLDIKMPKLTGTEMLKKIRTKSELPVIFLTSKDDELDEALGLGMGADDYITKPFSQRLLLARIRAVLRRSVPVKEETNKQTLSVGAVNLTPARRVACVDEIELQLTAAEFNVLALLMERAGQVASKEWLTEQVLHRKLTAYDRSIDVHVSRVRQKLEQAKPGLAEMIKTVRGEGYQMVVGVEG